MLDPEEKIIEALAAVTVTDHRGGGGMKRNTGTWRPKTWARRIIATLLLVLLVLLIARKGPCDPPPEEPIPADCKPGEACPVDAPATSSPPEGAG
ncbi:MAG: hypothetical protein EKK62_16510 [Acidimicrobiia bacterium]|nr:MAG: hypothetical protein EKK62_16510 [Acidimicrobiia bacterium]